MTQTLNVAACLAELSRRQPDVAALIEPQGTHCIPPKSERRWTFRELNRESDALALGLERTGLGRGMRVVLMAAPSIEFYALTYALLKLGAVVVLIDPGMGVHNVAKCLAVAEPAAFAGSPRAQLASVLFGWARKTLEFRVTLGRRPLWLGSTLTAVRRKGDEGTFVLADTRGDEIAAILFTSGSTGMAKGVVYTHRIIANQIAALRQMYEVLPGEIDLATYPLFGLFTSVLGITTILPEMDAARPGTVNPQRILNTIRYYQVSNLFGSPALLRQVAFSQEAKGLRVPTLRRVISAGAPVPAKVIRQVVQMLSPGVQVYTPYGATEALPVASIGSHEILQETGQAAAQGKGVCVGRPISGMEVRIIRISDVPIPTFRDSLVVATGEIGEIVVCGPVVTHSYYGRPEVTALHKIAGAQPGVIWHRMGDLGYFDVQGRIWFCGRKSQRVIIPEGTLYTIPCEGVFNAHPAVRRTALVGVPRDQGTEPVLCVELEPASARVQSLDRFRNELRQLGSRHAHTQGIQTFLIHPGFPVDTRHNAKIFREKLALWAARQLRNGS